MGIETQMPEEEQQPGQSAFTPPPSTQPSLPPQPTDWRELRRQERTERRAARRGDHGYNWVGGAILIFLGVIFLLQNTGLLGNFDNWWALFILIPAVGSFAAAWRMYQNTGNQWTAAATGSLISGLILSSIATMFLFGLNIGMWWPIFLIIGGISALLGARQWR